MKQFKTLDEMRKQVQDLKAKTEKIMIEFLTKEEKEIKFQTEENEEKHFPYVIVFRDTYQYRQEIQNLKEEKLKKDKVIEKIVSFIHELTQFETLDEMHKQVRDLQAKTEKMIIEFFPESEKIIHDWFKSSPTEEEEVIHDWFKFSPTEEEEKEEEEESTKPTRETRLRRVITLINQHLPIRQNSNYYIQMDPETTEKYECLSGLFHRFHRPSLRDMTNKFQDLLISQKLTRQDFDNILDRLDSCQELDDLFEKTKNPQIELKLTKIQKTMEDFINRLSKKENRTFRLLLWLLRTYENRYQPVFHRALQLDPKFSQNFAIEFEGLLIFMCRHFGDIETAEEEEDVPEEKEIISFNKTHEKPQPKEEQKEEKPEKEEPKIAENHDDEPSRMKEDVLEDKEEINPFRKFLWLLKSYKKCYQPLFHRAIQLDPNLPQDLAKEFEDIIFNVCEQFGDIDTAEEEENVPEEIQIPEKPKPPMKNPDMDPESYQRYCDLEDLRQRTEKGSSKVYIKQVQNLLVLQQITNQDYENILPLLQRFSEISHFDDDDTDFNIERTKIQKQITDWIEQMRKKDTPKKKQMDYEETAGIVVYGEEEEDFNEEEEPIQPIRETDTHRVYEHKEGDRKMIISVDKKKDDMTKSVTYEFSDLPKIENKMKELGGVRQDNSVLHQVLQLSGGGGSLPPNLQPTFDADGNKIEENHHEEEGRKEGRKETKESSLEPSKSSPIVNTKYFNKFKLDYLLKEIDDHYQERMRERSYFHRTFTKEQYEKMISDRELMFNHPTEEDIEDVIKYINTPPSKKEESHAGLYRELMINHPTKEDKEDIKTPPDKKEENVPLCRMGYPIGSTEYESYKAEMFAQMNACRNEQLEREIKHIKQDMELAENYWERRKRCIERYPQSNENVIKNLTEDLQELISGFRQEVIDYIFEKIDERLNQICPQEEDSKKKEEKKKSYYNKKDFQKSISLIMTFYQNMENNLILVIKDIVSKNSTNEYYYIQNRIYHSFFFDICSQITLFIEDFLEKKITLLINIYYYSYERFKSY